MIACHNNPKHKPPLEVTSDFFGLYYVKHPEIENAYLCRKCAHNLEAKKTLKRTWKDDNYRTRQLAKIHSPDAQRKKGLKSHVFENQIAKTLDSRFDHVFKPGQICDRICIKDGKLYFIEIKQKGQSLRPLQEKFRSLFHASYRIVTE